MIIYTLRGEENKEKEPQDRGSFDEIESNRRKSGDTAWIKFTI